MSAGATHILVGCTVPLLQSHTHPCHHGAHRSPAALKTPEDLLLPRVRSLMILWLTSSTENVWTLTLEATQFHFTYFIPVFKASMYLFRILSCSERCTENKMIFIHIPVTFFIAFFRLITTKKSECSSLNILLPENTLTESPLKLICTVLSPWY